jgi:hypothetical protein
MILTPEYMHVIINLILNLAVFPGKRGGRSAWVYSRDRPAKSSKDRHSCTFGGLRFSIVSILHSSYSCLAKLSKDRHSCTFGGLRFSTPFIVFHRCCYFWGFARSDISDPVKDHNSHIIVLCLDVFITHWQMDKWVSTWWAISAVEDWSGVKDPT